MTHVDIIATVAAELEMPKAQVERVFDSIVGHIAGSVMEQGEQVQIRNFGTFSPCKRAERLCRNPSTGGTIKVPAKTVLKFKPSKSLTT